MGDTITVNIYEGRDAYQIAVADGGFVGTREEWLESLKASGDLNPAVQTNLPRSGTLYLFGDSQSFGTNASGKAYAPAGRLKEVYRIPDIIGNSLGLTVNNLAIPGSRFSWKAGSEQSSYNQFGLLGTTMPTEGIISIMAGWNNLAQGAVPWSPEMERRWEVAQMAMIARALIDNWGGITTFGWTKNWTGSTDPSPIPGWSSTGTNNNQGSVLNPYPGDGLSTRYWIDLTAGQYVQFDVAEGVRAIGLFYETSPVGGGDFVVTLNGETIFEGNSQFAAPLGDHFPGVVWIENVGEGDTIRFEGVNGTTHWQAFGSVSDTADILKRLILVASPPANPAGGRTDDYLAGAFQAVLRAVSAFSEIYPVRFVDTQRLWLTARDQEPADISHLTAVGSSLVAAAFLRPEIPISASHPNVIR